jgi:glycosyltransferase involved in cell wall biosynthesis
LDGLIARPAGANQIRSAAMADQRGFLEREKVAAQIVKSTSRSGHQLTQSVHRQNAILCDAAAPGEQSPQLAVVVISVGAPAELVQAVGSLLAQPERLEIVVVNSGGGDPRTLLRRFGERIRIVSVERRLWPGAARNVGIAQTKAPFVAFLASDCTALKGWAAWRLNHHIAGAAAVASALVSKQPRNPFAVASHVSLFARRLPGVNAGDALRYGCSFARSLFDDYGHFREDIRTGEDTEFAARLPDRLRPIWAPQVRAAHNSPTTFTSMLLDQYVRGRRTAATRAALSLPEPSGSVRFAYSRFVTSMKLALRATKGRQRLAIASLSGLIVCCAVANALGMARGGLSEDARASEFNIETPPEQPSEKRAARVRATAA